MREEELLAVEAANVAVVWNAAVDEGLDVPLEIGAGCNNVAVYEILIR